MRYQNIHSQIWTDEKFIELSSDAKMLFIYVMTSPHSNSIGIYVLPKPYISCDLAWDIKRLLKPFEELLNNGLIFYDERVKLICVKNHLKYNPIENENQSKAASKIINELPKSHLYQTLMEQLNKQYHEPLRKVLKERYAQPETETETETEEQLSAFEPLKAVDGLTDFYITKKGRKLNGQSYAWFAKFWDAFSYPKGKAEAADAWVDIKNLDLSLFEKILSAAKNEAGNRPALLSKNKTPKWAQGWITGKRWEDEIEEVKKTVW
jgi:hypothetical protein